MKARVEKRLIPHLGVIVVIAIGLFLTRGWHYETALFPRAACTVVLVVAVISLFGELIRGREQTGHVDARVSSPLPGDPSHGRAVFIFGWLVLFMLGVWALGYPVAAVAFVFLFMKISGRQRWGVSILFSLISFAFLFSVFHLLLGVIWPRGAMWERIGL